MDNIIIRDLTTYEEFLQVREVQQACWGFSGGEGLYPPVLLTASQNGGVVLGAFDGDKMVGYLFGFLGLHENRGPLKLCSQTMGVLADYRGRGIAEQLKWAQRDRALKLGLKLVTWTYDPLEGPNAYLNLHKLNGIVRVYKRNVYGEHFGALNEGLPTDRFLVEWWVEQLSNIKPQTPALRAGASVSNLKGQVVTRVEGQRLAEYDLNAEDEAVRIEAPVNIQAMRQENLPLAVDWRIKTREIFETYFARGYVAVDFGREEMAGAQHNVYTLWRPPAEWLAKLTESVSDNSLQTVGLSPRHFVQGKL
jgi:predicted GNAT superfamily acetyltransferase